jgi:carbohydrate diacid regulator
MTLPIMSQNVVVGTVGITGTPDQVARFGQVVKRQTEILLGESALVWARLTRERVLESLLRDLLNYDPNDPADVTARARDFGFDLSLPRRAVVFEVQAPTRALTSSAPAMRLIREKFSDPQDIACSVSPLRHVILERQLRSGAGTATSELLRDLSAHIERVQGGRCVVGMGGVAADETEIRYSYSEALTALRLGPVVRAQSPFNIDDMRTHELVAAVPTRTRQRMIDSVLAGLREAPNWNAVSRTITAWAENGFVLVKTAEELGIHRNTLVYRLEKIAALTGLSLQDHRRWLTLYIGCVADHLHTST